MKFPKLFKTNPIGKEVKEMRKLLATLMTVMLVVSTSGIVLAVEDPDYATDGITSPPITASSGAVTGTAQVTESFSATLKAVSDGASAGSVDWATIVAGTSSWETAQQYIEVTGFATFSDWGIQLYTDNENATVNPYSGTGNPAGLVNQTRTIFSLPMCWRTLVGYYDAGTTTWSGEGYEVPGGGELDIIQGKDGNFTVLYDGVTPNDLDPADPDTTTLVHAPGSTTPYFPWFFLLDKETEDVDVTTAGDQAFGDYVVDATFVGSSGYHHAPGKDEPLNFATPNHPKDKYFIYLGANFTLAIPGVTYTTSTLTVEMYHY